MDMTGVILKWIVMQDLKLQDPERQLVMQGRLKRKGNSSSDSSEMQVFLFDHYLVLSKTKMQNHLEHYKVSRKVNNIHHVILLSLAHI